jgi:hypothetical protein
MNDKIRNLLIGIGFLALTIVVVMIALSGGDENERNVAKFNKDDSSKPKAVLVTNKINWGTINVNDTKESEIELKNDGNAPLQVTKLSTSCGCTSVRVSWEGKNTKEYSMHQELKEKIEIAPKTVAKIKIIYRPYTMPVEGAVTRQVFIETNDPVNKSFEILASAVVKK